MPRRHFRRIESTDKVNLDDRLKGIRGELQERREKVACSASNNEVNCTELLDALLDSSLQLLHVPDVDIAESKDSGSGSDCSDLLGYALCLVLIPANDTGVGS